MSVTNSVGLLGLDSPLFASTSAASTRACSVVGEPPSRRPRSVLDWRVRSPCRSVVGCRRRLRFSSKLTSDSFVSEKLFSFLPRRSFEGCRPKLRVSSKLVSVTSVPELGDSTCPALLSCCPRSAFDFSSSASSPFEDLGAAERRFGACLPPRRRGELDDWRPNAAVRSDMPD